MTVHTGKHYRLTGNRCADQFASCGSIITDAFIPILRRALSRLIVAISDDIASG
jgi:hypothetical protein